MIYHIVWSQLAYAYVGGYNRKQFVEAGIDPSVTMVDRDTLEAGLADFIKKSKNDTFLFVVADYKETRYKTSSTLPAFEAWLKKYDLEKLVRVKSSGITNPIHPDYKYNLILVCLQSEVHFQREEEKEKVNA